MTLSDFITKSHRSDRYLVRPRIVCNDGFFMSVQGNEFTYCSPRELSPYYNTMEIGFPSATEDTLLPYAEEADNPTGTIYGYVPVEIIEAVIEKHGGINEAETFISQRSKS